MTEGVFAVESAVYLSRPAGPPVLDLEELRQALLGAGPEVLFHHVQLPRLRELDDDESSEDDFTVWVRGVLQDAAIAERLGFVVQSAATDAAAVRHALTTWLATLPPAVRRARRAPERGALALFAAEAVPVAVGDVPATLDGVFGALAGASGAAWLHHLVEPLWWPNHRAWLPARLREMGAGALAVQCEREGAGRRSMRQVRRRLLAAWRRGRLGQRVLVASGESEEARHEAEHEAARQLARRLTRRRTS